MQMHSTKISGLAVDAEYTFHLVLRTTAGTRTSEKVTVRTHKMTDLSGITITTGIMSSAVKENLAQAVERIGAKIVDTVRIDTTHFVTTEGRGTAWEKAVETNIPVVRPEWVEACEKNGRILGVTKFYLDAMRPGPPSEERPSPPIVPKKDEPAPAPKDASSDKPKESAAPPPPSKDEEEEEEEDDDDEDETQQPEPKVKSPHPDDQKMRLEDKAEQKVALRPSTSSRPSDTARTEQTEDEEDDEDAEEEANGKKSEPSSEQDGASFQEVEL